MKLAFFNTKPYEKAVFSPACDKANIAVDFITDKLSADTAKLAKGANAVCCFVTDTVDAACLQNLKSLGVGLVALRSAGYDHVDLGAAMGLDIAICHVPTYSPAAVAEFAVGMLLTLIRKIHHAHVRLKQQDFTLDGQVGINLQGKTIGIIGTGNIGSHFCRIMLGFGCEVIAVDPSHCTELQSAGVHYTNLQNLLHDSDVISLHCPLNEATHHMINRQALSLMKSNSVIINTGRGALIDTTALIQSLSVHQIAGCALDVYEREHELFFEDHSTDVLTDPEWQALLKFDNVLLTPHQAYLTDAALTNIAKITVDNCKKFNEGDPENLILP